MLDTEHMPTARSVAEGLIGSPYLPGGRDVTRGVDCWGVVLEFYARAYGVELPDPASVDPDACEASPVAAAFERIEVGAAREGDVLRFALNRGDGGKGRHIGVKIGRNQVLHPTEKGGVVCHSTALYRFDAAFRFREGAR